MLLSPVSLRKLLRTTDGKDSIVLKYYDFKVWLVFKISTGLVAVFPKLEVRAHVRPHA